MVPKRFAILDLGSNTFHLLIVEQSEEASFREIFRKRVYTKLGTGGQDYILDASYKSGIECLVQFKAHLQQYQIGNAFLVVGTAALRTKENGPAFIEEVKDKTGITIQLIDGTREAELISIGALHATQATDGNHLVMDIGGGSVEFILLQNGEATWMKSFKVGVSILQAKFHQTDPIKQQSILGLNTFLETELQPLVDKLKEVPDIKTVIGASGSFEILQLMLGLPQWLPNSYRCHVLDYFRVKEQLQFLDAAARANVDNLPKERVDLIVVALLLMDFVLKITQSEEIQISNFALKEGAIIEYFDNF